MCTPEMAASMGIQVAGGALSYEAERQTAKAKESYYNYLAGQNEAQARTIAARGEQTATSIAETSAIDEANLNRSAKRVAGAQKAALGASGIGAGSVTAEDIVRDTAKTHELDVNALRFDADSRIWSARTAAADQAKALRDQAAQFRYAGANARYAGDIKTTASLLGTATSVADTWYRWNQTGAGRSPAMVKTPGRSYGGGYATAPDYGNV